MSTTLEPAAGTTPDTGRGRRITHWDPEDEEFWENGGSRVACRNLVFSVLAEHIGVCVWSLWSVMVLFMGPEYGLSGADKFLLVCVPTLTGAALRVPYGLAVGRWGGRNWTVVSALLLLLPTALAALVMEPGTSLGTFVLVAAVAGVGGGNFASSMANINAFFPQRHKGWALGVNAGGGNLGVAVMQWLGLAVLGTAGASRPRLTLWVLCAAIVVATVCAALFMDNLPGTGNDTAALRAAVRDVHCWLLCFLYLGTFGSFIGYGFALGLVLQHQFGQTSLQAAGFLGPLLGALTRPVGGWLSDRFGGARVTCAVFAALIAATALAVWASRVDSLPLFLVAFTALLALAGAGNGSTYKMIPAVFRDRTARTTGTGGAAGRLPVPAQRLVGAVIGVTGAVGALGGVFINLAFRFSFAEWASGVPAFIGFLLFYAVCLAVTRAVYLSKEGP